MGRGAGVHSPGGGQDRGRSAAQRCRGHPAGGHRLAIELQRGELSDAEWIARHEDYAWAGITDMWLYHPDTRAPRIVFRHRQPGWRFDPGARTLGLVHAQPSRADAWTSPYPTQCRSVHWPPCPADQLATKWMPLASARLTPDGIKPSVQTTAELDRLAAIAARELAAELARAEVAARTRDERDHAVVLRSTAGKVDAPRDGGQFPETHEAFRWDPLPPEADPDTWCFGCNICGLELTGAMLRVSPVVHVIRTMERTRAGLPREIELRYGGARSLGQILGRLTTAHAALDLRSGWRDGQRCKLAQLADAGGNHGASLHRD
jgi:hypothetical protein